MPVDTHADASHPTGAARMDPLERKSAPRDPRIPANLVPPSSLTGAAGGHHSVRTASLSKYRHDRLTFPPYSTATGKASDKGAHNTVNGYMAFVLFSVAGLSRKSYLASLRR